MTGISIAGEVDIAPRRSQCRQLKGGNFCPKKSLWDTVSCDGSNFEVVTLYCLPFKKCFVMRMIVCVRRRVHLTFV